MTHAQGDRWDVYREQIRLDADGKPEALFQGEWEPLLMREEHFQIHEDDGSISEHSEVFWASPRHGVVLAGDPLTDSEVCCARWGLEAAAHDIDAILALHRAQDVTTTHARLPRPLHALICLTFSFSIMHSRIECFSRSRHAWHEDF